jgi:hypothetical protein
MKNHRIKEETERRQCRPAATPATALTVAGSAVVQLLTVATTPNTRVMPASDLVEFTA